MTVRTAVRDLAYLLGDVHGFWLSRRHWRITAQWTAALLALTLPWSTSATSIAAVSLLVAGLCAVSPRQASATFGRPVVLATLALPLVMLVATAWTIAPFEVAADQFDKYGKLVFVGLLLAVLDTERSVQRVMWALIAAFSVVLLLSWLSVIWPSGPWGWMTEPGVPVKNYSVQSTGFALGAFALGHLAIESWRVGRRRAASLFLLGALACLVNVLFVAAARSTWVSLLLLAALFSFQRIGARGAVIGLLIAALLAPAMWLGSPYFRDRVSVGAEEFQAFFDSDDAQRIATETSVGIRLALWENGLEFISEAPLFGHGTGSILPLYQRAEDAGSTVVATDDPHNQFIAVAIPYGALGLAALAGLWIALAAAFFGSGLYSWLGQAFVLQQLVASMFDSVIWIFERGWLFVVLAATLIAARNLGGPGAAGPPRAANAERTR